MKLFASIYIGSYVINMKIYEVNKESGLKEIDSLKTPTDIIKDVLLENTISFDTTDKLCKVLLDMKKTMEAYKVDGYCAYAGPNIRNASNELFVLEQIKLRTGLKVQVISNSEQRFLGYESIASMNEFDDLIGESAVLVDVGGMSLQITLFSKGKIVTTQHLLLGTVSVQENIKKIGSVSNAIDQTYEMMNKELDVFKTMFLKDIEPKYMILLGDHVNSVAQTILGKNNSKTKSADYIKALNKINRSYVDSLVAEFDFYMDNENLVEPFVMLYKALISVISPEYVMTPGLSVCDGMALEHSYKKKWLKASHDFDSDVISAAWAIAKRYGSYQPHLKALVKLSSQLFDVTKNYHGMGKREKLLMETVAILHDCGKYISLAEASECSYQIIMSSEILGLTHKEREIIATTVAFNRKPLESYDALSDRFTTSEYVIIVKLLAILKVANALDRSHKQKFKNVSMHIKNHELIITMESNTSIALEKGLFSKNADFFEQILSIRPVLKEKRVIE